MRMTIVQGAKMKLIDIETTQPITVADENGRIRQGCLFIDGKTRRVDAIPLDFIDQQINHYRQLFEESLYKNDDYDEKARMMVDSLSLLKRRWKEHERIHKD